MVPIKRYHSDINEYLNYSLIIHQLYLAVKGKVYQLFNASFAVFLCFYNYIKYTVFASLALQYLAVDSLDSIRINFAIHTNYMSG